MRTPQNTAAVPRSWRRYNTGYFAPTGRVFSYLRMTAYSLATRGHDVAAFVAVGMGGGVSGGPPPSTMVHRDGSRRLHQLNAHAIGCGDVAKELATNAFF